MELSLGMKRPRGTYYIKFPAASPSAVSGTLFLSITNNALKAVAQFHLQLEAAAEIYSLTPTTSYTRTQLKLYLKKLVADPVLYSAPAH